jgi:hypothetical protein
MIDDPGRMCGMAALHRWSELTTHNHTGQAPDRPANGPICPSGTPAGADLFGRATRSSLRVTWDMPA